jgi:hypothetical protein
LTGQAGNAYDLEKLNGAIWQAGYRDVFVSYAPFPPFTSIVFAPFLLFSPLTAKILFNTVSCLLFLLTLMRARLVMGLPPWLAIVLPVLFFVPLVNNLFFGQAYLLLTVLLLEGYLAHKQRRFALAGLLWGTAVLFKLFPGVILFWLLLRKEYRTARWLCSFCALLLLLSIGLNGWEIWKYYGTEIFPKVNNGELNSSFTYYFQSACMLIKKGFVYDALYNTSPLTDSPMLFGILLGLFKATILTASIAFTLRGRDKDGYHSFAVWMTSTILISPNGSSYSLVLLIIPLLALGKARTGLLSALLLLAVICFIPVNRLEHFPAWAQYPRLYLLLFFFFGLMIRPLRSAWHGGVFAGSVSFFLLLSLASYPRGVDRSRYFFSTEEHIFINDYWVSDGSLFYSYRDETGSHTVPAGLPVAASSALGLEGKQILYGGRPVTQSGDTKRKPMLINGTTILYLSDKNRGPGFYTLRKLELAGGR